MNIKDILKKENIGRKFKFIINGKPSNKTHTIMLDSSRGNSITYFNENRIVMNIKQILEQNRKYNYEVELIK